jgi:hypothetical protein
VKALQTTCFILVLLILLTQSGRHFYVKYLGQTSSILDRYKEEINKEIKEAGFLEDLVAKYDPAKKQVEKLDALEVEQQKAKPEKDREAFRTEFQEEHKKEYERETELRSAILDWESKSNEINELRFFWAFGFGLFILGCIIYVKLPWLGMAFVIPGVVEMVWWTSPTFNFGGTVHEFERLLTNKLVFTNITLLLLVTVWIICINRGNKHREQGNL